MLRRLMEACREGSACLVTLAHPDDDPPPPDVYRPEGPATEDGLLDFLSSTQSVLLLVTAALAITLLLATVWRNRRDEPEDAAD